MRFREFDHSKLQNRLREDEDDLPSVERARAALPQILARVQQDYDDWDEQDRDTYAGGGICHIIADTICDVLSDLGIDCTPVSCSYEQHVYIAARFAEGVYTIDIPYHVYETGGGFSWQKIPDVRFSARDVVFYRVSGDPADWRDYIDEGLRGITNFVRNIGRDRDAPIVMMTNPANRGARTASNQRISIEDFPLKTVAVAELQPWEPMIKMQDLPSKRTVMNLTQTLRQGGRIPPLLVTPVRGGYRIIDGHHRYAALQRAGIDRVEVRVVDPRLIRYSDEVMEALRITLQRYGHLGRGQGGVTEVVKMPPTKNSSQGMADWAYQDAQDKKVPLKGSLKGIPTEVYDMGDHLRVFVKDDQGPVLYLALHKFLDGFKSGAVAVEPRGRGKNLAVRVYQAASDTFGRPIYSDTTQTDASRIGIWQKLMATAPDRVVGYDQRTREDLPLTVTDRGPAVRGNQPVYTQRTAKDLSKPVSDQNRSRTRLLKLLPNHQVVREGRIKESKIQRNQTQDLLSQIPTLIWQPVNRNVWNTIQDEGLDEEQDAPNRTDWLMAFLSINQRDAQALQALDDDAIEKFNRFDIQLKSRYPGLTDLIDYDNGTVTIVKTSQPGIQEGRVKDMDMDLQDQQWEAVVGFVQDGVRRGRDADRMSIDLYRWAGGEQFDVDEELERRGFRSVTDLADHIRQHGGRYVPPEFDLSGTASLRDIERLERRRDDDVQENFAAVSEVNAAGELTVDPDLIQRFTDRGWEIDGEGRDQIVMSRPGSRTVLKIVGQGTDTHTGEIRRAMQFFRDHQHNPHFPRVGLDRTLDWKGQKYYAYTQERLRPLSGDEEILDYLEYAMSEIGHGEDPDYSQAPPGLDVEQVDGLVSAIYDMFDEGMLTQTNFDLGNVANIMQRANGQLVIVDPVSFDQDLAENFADGKVKGKSRPGRVKRAGASCKGSVPDLRARAKKYGGERGKMYHWCANMKSGRKNK